MPNPSDLVTFSHDPNPWAEKMIGPWGRRRHWLEENLDLSKWSFEDLANEENTGPELDWLIEGFPPNRYLIILGGDSKCGKSWFVTSMALHIATGLPFLGLETKKRPVVWVSFEENRVERRLAFDAWFASGGQRPEKLHFVTSFEPLYIDEALGLQQIVEAANGIQAGLVVIDPLHAAYSAGNISDGATARRVLAGVKKITQDLDCSVLIIHHLTKQSGLGLSRERMSDSGQILAAASMDWLVESSSPSRSNAHPPPPYPKEEGGRGVEVPESLPQESRKLRILGRGRGELVNRNWLISSPAPMQYELVGEGDKPLNTPLEDQILEVLSVKSLTAREIAEEIGASVASVRNVMTKLIAKSHAHVRSIDGRERTYAVPRASRP